MSPRAYQPANVLEASVERLTSLYADGRRVLISFSGGKDSIVVLETAILAARATNRLPVEVVLRDEELGWPDHYEFCERTANRPEVDLTWFVAREPHSYAFDREQPFWWAFDWKVEPDRWVRRPPADSVWIPEITIRAIDDPARWPTDDGRPLVSAIGIRAAESRNRLLGVFSMGGWITKPNHGVVKAWPAYDWRDKDVWHAIRELGWDAPRSYTQLYSAGVRGSQLRAGAWLNRFAAPMIPTAARIWPRWFNDHVYPRFPGLERIVRMGPTRFVSPRRKPLESWEQTFWRECVETAPSWIAERAIAAAAWTKTAHERHFGTAPIPDAKPGCFECGSGRGSWQDLAEGIYLGDPFSEFTASVLPYVEPEFFRPELAGTPAGRWGGHPG